MASNENDLEEFPDKEVKMLIVTMLEQLKKDTNP